MANVNRPTDFAQKERDVNQKLQFYGIFSAFSNGKVPSNHQIDVALNSFLASRALSSPSKNLSAEGRELVSDVKTVINESKRLLLEKNDGNLLQEFIWDAQHIDGANAGTPNAPVDRSTAQHHGEQATDGIKTLGRLILSNGQFRKLIDDALVLFRDMAGDAAQKAANKVNPDEDRLRRIDEPADDNTWHDVPSRGDIKGQMSDTFNRNKPFSRDDVKEATQQGRDTAQQHPSSDNRDAGRAGVKNVVDNLRHKAEQNIPDEKQGRAREVKDTTKQNTKNYLHKKMPKERRDQAIWRLKKMIVEIQGHSDYQEAIETLLNLAETYAGHTQNIAQQATGNVKSARKDTALRRTETNLKTLIERFANFTSLDDLFDSLDQLYRDADRDPELKGWFRHLNKYTRRSLREQGYILQDDATREWDQLYDQGQFLFRERYRDHTDHLIDEVQFMVDQFDSDPQNKRFADAMQKLFLDLGQDDDGKPTFKPHLLKDLTEVIIPGIFANTQYVPIPRIEVSDPMADLIVENLVIESDNLFPNSLEFGSDNYWRMGRKNLTNARQNKVMIAASGIQMDLRDVAYYVRKKQGFPTITDKGVMDIILAGEGFSFKVNAHTARKTADRRQFLVVDNVDVSIKNLAIKIKKSNHKLLFSIAKGLVLKLMRPAIQKAIEKVVKDNLNKADAAAYGIYSEVQRGKEAAKQNPEQAANIFQRYTNAFQQKATEKKKKAEEVNKRTDVNVALTQEDSMFKNISLPGGISTKATEYRELARKGDRWESPVFSIGSARATSNLPAASKITRKPHHTREAGVRGGNHPNASNTPIQGEYRNAPGVASSGPSSYGNQQSGGDSGSYGGQSASYGGQSGVGGLSSYENQQSTGGYSSYGGQPATGGLSSYDNQPAGGLSSYDNQQSTGGYSSYGSQPTTGTSAYGSSANPELLAGGGQRGGYTIGSGTSTEFGGPTGTSTVPHTSSNLSGFSNQVDSALNPSSGTAGTHSQTGQTGYTGQTGQTGQTTFYDSITK